MKENEFIKFVSKNTLCDYSKNQIDEQTMLYYFKDLKSKLDCRYLSFIQNLNGFELNGMNFYGTKEVEKLSILDVFVENRFYNEELSLGSHYWVIGDGDIDIFCYCMETCKYLVLDKNTFYVVAAFDTLEMFFDYLSEVYG